MKVQRFEDLIAWQKARELTKRVYQLTRLEPFCRDFGLSNQIQRSAVSVMSNVAEGNSRNTTKEYIHFLYQARGSLEEVRYFLLLSKDLEYFYNATYQNLEKNCEDVSKMLNGLLSSLKRKTKT